MKYNKKELVIPTIKVISSGCNLRCKYCYYHNYYDQSNRLIMSDETLENLIKKTIDFVDKDSVDFIWHGGEPLLAGIPFYKRVIEIQKHIKTEKKIVNKIQTNATLITKKWADFFARQNFSVGVSIDGPKDIHDKCRVSSSNKGSYDHVKRGISLLQSVGIYPTALAMITSYSLGRVEDIFNYFVDNLGSFHLKPCYELDHISGKLAEFSVDPEEYVDFMIEVFDLWFEKDDPKIKVRSLSQIICAMVKRDNVSLCEFSGECPLFCTVESDGSVGPCDSFPIRKYYYGNINEINWHDILNSEGYNNFVADLEKNREECKLCKWYYVCNGGCAQYSYSIITDSWHKNKFCEAKKRLFEHISSRVMPLLI